MTRYSSQFLSISFEQQQNRIDSRELASDNSREIEQKLVNVAQNHYLYTPSRINHHLKTENKENRRLKITDEEVIQEIKAFHN